MERSLQNKFEQIAPMIGNTPLLEIRFRFHGKERRIFAKAQAYKLTGSIKDRVAHYVLKKAYEEGRIRPGETIVEATSGNTGIAFSALGSYLGHPVVIYMPDWMSRERISLMESFGAQVHLVSREEGGFLGSIELTEQLARQGGVFLPKQFSNAVSYTHLDVYKRQVVFSTIIGKFFYKIRVYFRTRLKDENSDFTCVIAIATLMWLFFGFSIDFFLDWRFMFFFFI